VTADAEELSRRIDLIERGYEYLLAFAAQGRRSEAGSEVRGTLTGMHAALQDLERVIAAALAQGGAPPHDAAEFLAAVRADAGKASGAIAFTLNCASIGSQLIDNLNASIHVRALLTDLFLIDQALKQGR